MRAVLFAFLVTRLVVFLAVAWSVPAPVPWHAIGQWSALDGWIRGEAFEYLHRAGGGHWPVPAGSAPLFPLYPLVCRFVPLPPTLTGLVLSQLACLAALAGVDRWARRRGQSGRAAVWLVACWPFSYSLAAFLPDSLTLALCVWALVACQQERWWAALGLAGLACYAGPLGWLTFATLAGVRWRGPEPRVLVFPVLGGYLSAVGWPGLPVPAAQPADLLAGGLALGLAPLVWRRCGLLGGVYCLAGGALSLAGLGSVTAGLLPAFVTAAAALGEEGALITGLAMLPLEAVLAWRYAMGSPLG